MVEVTAYNPEGLPSAKYYITAEYGGKLLAGPVVKVPIFYEHYPNVTLQTEGTRIQGSMSTMLDSNEISVRVFGEFVEYQGNW